MKTILFNGMRYNIAYIYGNEVVVDIPTKQVVGNYVRFTIKFSQLTKRQRVALRKLQGTV